MNKRLLILSACVVVTALGTMISAEFMGADTVLKKLANVPASRPVAEGNDELSKAINTFSEEAGKLTADERADRWLGLWDMAAPIKEKGRSRTPYEYGSSEKHTLVMRVIPSPESWGRIVEGLKKRAAENGVDANRAAAMELLAGVLANDREGITKTMEKIQEKGRRSRFATDLKSGFVKVYGVQAVAREPFEAQLASAEEGKARWLTIPSTPELLDFEKSAAMWKRIVETKATLYPEDRAVLAVLKRAILANIDTVPVARWSLVETPDDLQLYEKLLAKFPTGGGVEYDDSDQAVSTRDGAQQMYMLALVKANRGAEALVLAKKMRAVGKFGLPGDGVVYMIQSGKAGELFEMLNQFIAAQPNQTEDTWRTFLKVSVHAKKTTEMLATVKETLANKSLTAENKIALQEKLLEAQLAADDVDGALVTMRAQIAEGGKNEKATGIALGSAGAMVRLGAVLKRNDLIDEGKGAILKHDKGSTERFLSGMGDEAIASALVAMGRMDEAEAFIVSGLEKTIKRMRSNEYSYQDASDGLAMLASVYAKAKRWPDVMKLLEQSPDWGVADIAQLSRSVDTVGDESFLVIVGRTLMEMGRKEEAAAIAEQAITQSPRDDDGYALLLDLKQEEAIKVFEAEFARDQFEERPMVWKAEALRRAGKLEAAEAVARQAIQIDPSDGHTGKGKRMKVYAVLSEILRDRGDAKNAAFFADVVTAIRMSEDADTLAEAGLLKRSLVLYEESLKHFADAYCIQSRLAIKYMEAGEVEKAEEHYRKAFELMPDSFGRMESHCFGCEGAFRGAQAQGIAEKVFSQLVKTQPMKAQVHYLLGYLRGSQGRKEEALKSYRQAVMLDPDYINAWKKMQDLTEKVSMPEVRRDEITLNLSRLDPLDRHGVELESLAKVSEYWKIAERAKALEAKPAKTLLALPASAKAGRRERVYDVYSDASKEWNPSAMLARQAIVSAVLMGLDN